MANATAFVSTILPKINTNIEEITFSSATRVEISDGPTSWRTVYYGDFTISGTGEITGTIDRVVKFFDGVKHYAINGLSANAGLVFTSILDDLNEGAAAAHLMRKADVMDGSSASDAIRGFAGNDTMRGNGGNEQMYGGDGYDRMLGGADHDHLRGDAGYDTLFGNDGNDVLDAGDGRDRLIGGKGDDELHGGAGRDTFVFGKGDGDDEIIAFEDGIDLIEIHSGAEGIEDLTIQGGIITFANVRIVLSFPSLTLGAEDFIFT